MQNILLYAVSVLVWGSTWFVIKFQLGTVDPALSVAYRFFLASVLMFSYGFFAGKLKEIKFTRRQMGFVALQGFLLFFLNYWFTYHATFYLTSGLVAVCFSTITIMNIINQRIFFRIPFRRQVILGSVLGLCGIALVFWPEIHSVQGGTAMTGIILCLIGTYLASLGNIASLRNSRAGFPVFLTSCYGMAFGAAFSLIAALAGGAALNFDPSFNYIWSLTYLAVFGSAVAFLSYLTLLARIGADRASYSAVLVPIVALAISTVFEHYSWSEQSAVGVVLIIAGNVLALGRFKSFERPQEVEIANVCGQK